MGYKNNSPVKQVWLPLEYDFIDEHDTDDFGTFSKAYKEKYGIDLHDIFLLNKFEESDTTNFNIGLKVDLVGAYNHGNLRGNVYLKGKMAIGNAVEYNFYLSQQMERDVELVTVIVSDKTDNVGFGFKFILPAIGRTINSIDDLTIHFYEI